MQRSESIGELIAALAKAQLEFTPALKTTRNTYFDSKYADLAANIDAVRPALNKHGIAILQFPEVDLELQTVSVVTALHHGEQFISQTFAAPAVGSKGFNVQSIGAATTYLRRYGIQALCGLASEDDDGNSVATDNKPITKAKAAPKAEPREPLPADPSPQPEKPILAKEFPSAEVQQEWHKAFAEADSIEAFNAQVVPLMRERGREFIIAASAEAKRRGYKVDRVTGGWAA
jgi:hypothetical protein